MGSTAAVAAAPTPNVAAPAAVAPIAVCIGIIGGGPFEFFPIP